jgi:uncharacterized protein
MLYLLSPAKSLDYDTPVPDWAEAAVTEPRFATQAAELIRLLKPLSASQVGSLMDLSDSLSSLNAARYKAWRRKATPQNSKPAVLAFNGDVYDGLQAGSLSPEDLTWMQSHVLILSGLYGALQPMDRLQPYRLEMGTALANPAGRDLYAFWDDRIVKHLHQRLREQATPVVVNLASQEYARVVLRPSLKARVVHCHFEDEKNGEFKIISFFAKRARGLMCRWAVQARIDHPEALIGFQADGYAHDPDASADRGDGHLVFRRRGER